MKTTYKHLVRMLMFIGIVTATLTLALAVSAQDLNTNGVPTSGNATVDAGASLAAGVLAALTGKYGWLLTVIAWIGVLRAAVKPLMVFIEAVVKATPGTADDEAIARFEAGPIYRWLVFGLDWIASIKLPGRNTNPLVK